MTNVDQLGTLAADTAMRATVEYCRTHKMRIVDIDAAVEAIKYYVKARLEQALADAKAAFDCGMGHVAQQTFLASMRLAGIEAAKDVCVPMNQE